VGAVAFRQSARERGAIYDKMEPRHCRAAHIDHAAAGLRRFRQAGNYFARQIGAGASSNRSSETESIEAMDRLIAWLPEHIRPGEATAVVQGIPHGQLIFHPERAEDLAVLDWELSTLGHPARRFSYHA